MMNNDRSVHIYLLHTQSDNFMCYICFSHLLKIFYKNKEDVTVKSIAVLN